MTKQETAPDAPLFDLESAYLDIDAIEAGQWVPLGSEFPGLEVFTKGLTASAPKKLREQLERTAPKSDRLSNGQLSENARDNILKTVIARRCISDWRGFAVKGKVLPFSIETLESLLKEPRARRIAAAIVGAILDLEQKTVEASDTVSGNSPAP